MLINPELSAEHDAMQRKNEELAARYNEKNRKLLQTQELYDKVKRQAERGEMQRAAVDTVDSTLNATQYLPPNVEDTWHNHEMNDRYQVPAFGQTPRHSAAGVMNIGASRVHQGYGGEGRWIRQDPPQRSE